MLKLEKLENCIIPKFCTKISIRTFDLKVNFPQLVCKSMLFQPITLLVLVSPIYECELDIKTTA